MSQPKSPSDKDCNTKSRASKPRAVKPRASASNQAKESGSGNVINGQSSMESRAGVSKVNDENEKDMNLVSKAEAYQGVSVFPDPRKADESGLIAVGGELSIQNLVDAYSNGIFPWPREGMPMLWFSPPERGVIEFSKIHWPKRFLRELRTNAETTLTANTSFTEVIRACSATPRSHEAGTWILPEMIAAYEAMFEAGHAFSIEAWNGSRLVGGLYGLYINGNLCGESMFFREPNASKKCLFALIQVASKFGIQFLDIQMVTPVLESFGGEYISRDEFLDRLLANAEITKSDANKGALKSQQVLDSSLGGPSSRKAVSLNAEANLEQNQLNQLGSFKQLLTLEIPNATSEYFLYKKLNRGDL
jgi:leucyl/phenylalanyl-tRNA---protein transferase